MPLSNDLADFFQNREITETDAKENSGVVDFLKPEKHQLVFKFERRNGRPVTLVGPFSLEEKALKEVLKKVKKKLGAGGSLEEEWMAIQGDVKEKLKTLLESESFRFRKK